MTAPTQSGFSLPLVLLLIGAFAGAAALAVATARGHARGSVSATGVAQAEGLADAGVAIALMALERSQSFLRTPRSPSGGEPGGMQTGAQAGRWSMQCSIGDAALRLAIQDEGGKVDLNFAGTRLLTALFVGLGQPRVRAQALADAIVDFRDPDDDRLPFGAERDDYLRAGRVRGPKNANFTEVAEVRGVLGLTEDLADRMTPFVTVHSGRDGIDPAVADKALIEILVRGEAETAPASGGGEEQGAMAATPTALPAMFVQTSLRRYYAITADAALPNARFIRETIVDSGTPAAARRGVSGQLVARFRLWSWRRGHASDRAGDATVLARTLPPC